MQEQADKMWKRAAVKACTLVDLAGLQWLDWLTTSLTIILAICHAISSCAWIRARMLCCCRVFSKAYEGFDDNNLKMHRQPPTESLRNIFTSERFTWSELPWTHFFIAWENTEPKTKSEGSVNHNTLINKHYARNSAHLELIHTYSVFSVQSDWGLLVSFHLKECPFIFKWFHVRNISSQWMQFSFINVFHCKHRTNITRWMQSGWERLNHCTFRFLGIWLRLRLPDELTQLIHLPKCHLSVHTEKDKGSPHENTSLYSTSD